MALVELPGLIDLHVHLRDPGQTEKEDFLTGTSAAIAGGFTTIIDMPNNAVPITSLSRLRGKIYNAKRRIVCDVGFYFGTLGDNFSEFDKVKNLVWGLKVYLNQTTGGYVVDKKVLERIFLTWPKNSPILFHAEDRTVVEVLSVLQKKPRRVHFCHVSNREELEPIIRAKGQGLPVSCGVTPHHLFFVDADAKKLGAYGIMRPPLRSKKDQNFLWKNLRLIDVIESDHAPHTRHEKESASPPNGVPGLETTLPLLLTAVSQRRLTIDDIQRLCIISPAKILGFRLDKSARIEIDRQAAYTIGKEAFFTKCDWSPFTGWKVKGKVRRVFWHAKKVFEDGRILVQPGFGEILTPK